MCAMRTAGRTANEGAVPGPELPGPERPGPELTEPELPVRAPTWPARA